jgi:hypothetical protein
MAGLATSSHQAEAERPAGGGVAGRGRGIPGVDAGTEDVEVEVAAAGAATDEAEEEAAEVGEPGLEASGGPLGGWEEGWGRRGGWEGSWGKGGGVG